MAPLIFFRGSIVKEGWSLPKGFAWEESRAPLQPSPRDLCYCCKKYVMKPIPRRLLASYYYASIKCPLPAVVFQFYTNKEKNIKEKVWIYSILHPSAWRPVRENCLH
uniref:Chemokine interleukin-8-like domain-containing protein n=1 Tax=Podarcis muralis TaxID=64176 RepID=A0A670JQP3_PODMU